MRRVSTSLPALALLLSVAGCQGVPGPIAPAQILPTSQTTPSGSLQPTAAGSGPPHVLCTGRLVGGTFASIVVPSGATCKLSQLHVAGSVKVEPGGALQLFSGQTSGNTIDGDVQAEGARWITSGWHPGNTIGGSVRITGTTGVPRLDPSSDQPSPANYFCRTSVGGNVQIEAGGSDARFNFGAHGVSLGVANCTAPNRVGGSIRVDRNSGELWVANNIVAAHVQASRNAVLHVFLNAITGALRCDGNLFIDGWGNTAASKKGQCAAF